MQLLLNILSIATATNNIEFPSAGVTKSYNNKHRVLFDGVLLGLQDTATHNVKYFKKYYAEKWPESKVTLLLGKDQPNNVPMDFSQTFVTIGKYNTTYKKKESR